MVLKVVNVANVSHVVRMSANATVRKNVIVSASAKSAMKKNKVITKMNEAIELLKKWEVEAKSGHNDGYVQRHYKEKLEEVRNYLEDL